MVSWVKKLVAAILVATVAILIVSRNLEQITLRLWPGREFNASVGVIVIMVFFTGVACAALISLFFGIKAYFRERRLHKNDQQRSAFYFGMLKARALSSTEEWSKAREEWQKLTKIDPTQIIARLELAHCMDGLGATREALKIIDGIRAEKVDNIEVLLKAVDLNLKLGNKTAAIDNLALIMYHQPNPKTAALARDLSEQLNRIDDALEYQKELDRLAERDEISTAITQRLRLKIILRDYKEEELLAQLRTFAKQNNCCAEGHYHLAQEEKLAGNLERAAEQLLQAAKVGERLEYWEDAISMWLDSGQPEKALSAARTAARSAKGCTRLFVEMGLIKLYLRLNMLEEASSAIEDYPKLSENLGYEITPEINQTLMILKGLLLARKGDCSEAANILDDLLGPIGSNQVFDKNK